MLKYKMVNDNGKMIEYHYFQKDNEKTGKVTIDKTNGQIELIEPSESDFGNRFANKLIDRLEYFYKTGDYKNEGIIAWY